jgi:hypothetical protein
MKKVLVSLLAVMLLTTSLFAQQKRAFKPSHQHQQKTHLAKQLSFSAEQKAQAKLYKENTRKQLQKLNKNENITVKEFRDRKAAILKEQKTKMQGLLTAEQKAKLTELKVQRKEKAVQAQALHLQKMKTKLNLSDDQVAQMKAQHDKVRAQMGAIKNNDKLSRVERKEKMTALKAEAREQRKKIFTEEQLKKMGELKKNKAAKMQAK